MTDQIPTMLPEEPSADNTPRKASAGTVIVIALLAAFLVFLWFGLKRTYSGPVQVGQNIKDFTLQTFDGQTYSTEKLKGKVLFINFWASWCTPCESESAILQQAWEKYQPGGEVIFMGVDYVDTEPEALASMKKYSITYPNGPDLRTSISQQFRISGVPETYIVDQTGKVISIQIGPYGSVEEISAVIDPLLQK
jgi:cytochrome c biogenesis protein CcmG, thiol:disulfide interchange protein DsbE